MFVIDRSCRVAAALIASLAIASVAFAGPPLICHPFNVGAGAPVLPWAEGDQWHLPHTGYERANLISDTLSLLSADAPVLVRMENMRRAAIYAEESPSMAAALLRAVVERTTRKPADARTEALEWFDAGYLLESYRQLDVIYQHGMLPSHGRATSLVPEDLEELDGYTLVQKAARLAPEFAAELDFASALMTREPLTTTHLRRAASSAAAGSLLAQNLVHYARR
jgi:hypothetical protein